MSSSLLSPHVHMCSHCSGESCDWRDTFCKGKVGMRTLELSLDYSSKAGGR